MTVASKVGAVVFSPVVDSAIVALLAAMAVFSAGWIAYKYFKRRLLERDETPKSTSATLTSMRAMRDEGLITEEEYRQMRRRLARKMSEEVDEKAGAGPTANDASKGDAGPADDPGTSDEDSDDSSGDEP